MNADLEETLNELGPEYRAVVGRLRSASEVWPRAAICLRKPRGCPYWPLVAALLPFVAVGLAMLLADRASGPATGGSQPTVASYGPREYRMTTDEMIATQRADGGWANDFLTRRNAEALRKLDDPRARLAYRKALRNLRLRQAL